MKKIFVLSILVLFTLCFASCDDDSKDPSPTTGTIVVKATYSGAEPTASGKASTFTPGTKIIFVYVYSALTNTDTSRATTAYTVQTDAAVTVGTEYTLTINNVTPGSYKVVAFYDYRAGDNLSNQGDKFEIYDNAADPDNATVVTVEAGSTDELIMGIDGTNSLLSSSYFVAQPAR